MAYSNLNLTDGVSIWSSAEVRHLEDGFQAIAMESEQYPGCFYRTVNGETEWLNPPMASGVEYKTTRRHMGQPVYCKVIEYTNTAAFGSDSGTTGKAQNVPHGISNLNMPVEVRGWYAGSYSLPYRKQAGGTLFIGQITSTNIVLQSYQYAVDANKTWRFEIFYTKN